jgi:endoglucanase
MLNVGVRAGSKLIALNLAAAAVLCAAENLTAIKVDQAGYRPEAPKIAAVTSSKTHQSFSVRRSDNNSVVLRGKLGAPVHDADSGDDVQRADFSILTKSGRYFVDVPGVGRSWTFEVRPDVYRRPYYLAMRSYYGQRCGTAVDLGPDFPQFRHGPCHLIGAFHSSTGQVEPHSSAKGWHDAGDYGRYVVNSGITTATLLWAWELYGDRIGSVGLKIPESGHGVPDILSEIRWNLDWMLSLQDYDGGFFHKQTSDHFSGFVMPEQDTLTSFVIGTGQKPFKSSCATADGAAVFAIAARVYRSFDPAFAGVALKASRSAWNWVQQNPNVTFSNPEGITTGAYGDGDCSDERLWAAAELWRTTGDQDYSTYFLDQYASFLPAIRSTEPQTWSNLAPLALWSYALADNGEPVASAAIRNQSLQAAEQIASRTATNGYQTSLTTKDYIWGSNAVAMNYAMQLLVAYRFRPDERFLQSANDDVHYVLGTNPFSLSWVTQVGEHAFSHPHHRPSAADGLNAPWPGLLSGGPNPGRQDPVMKARVFEGIAPAKAYVDDTGAYACNEVAINWNAPLVFVLAGLLPPAH